MITFFLTFYHRTESSSTDTDGESKNMSVDLKTTRETEQKQIKWVHSLYKIACNKASLEAIVSS